MVKQVGVFHIAVLGDMTKMDNSKRARIEEVIYTSRPLGVVIELIEYEI